MTPFAIKITIVRLICWKFSGVRRVFSTGKFALIRVPQYWIIGVKGGCKGTEYSKVLKKPLSSSTGIVSDTLIYHNACSNNKRSKNDATLPHAIIICLLCAKGSFFPIHTTKSLKQRNMSEKFIALQHVKMKT